MTTRRMAIPGDYLYKNAKDKHCVLTEVTSSEVLLPLQFIADLCSLLSEITKVSIAEDVLNNAIARETLTRMISPANPAELAQTMNSGSSMAVIVALLLRIPPTVKPRVGPRRKLSIGERRSIFKLLYSYGVGCAETGCCGIPRMLWAGKSEFAEKPDHRVLWDDNTAQALRKGRSARGSI